ncbi:MAG: GrpB family protein [bacterium]
MLGLPPGTVKLSPFSPQWEKLYKIEEKRIADALGALAMDIQHIGSTSIPGLSAKPVIDIAIMIPQISDLDKCIPLMESAGFEYLGDFGLPGRNFFVLGNPRTCHVHMVEKGSNHWKQWIIFRDYLVAHPDVAEKYDSLKKELAEKFPNDRESYLAGKAPLIAEILENAAKELG